MKKLYRIKTAIITVVPNEAGTGSEITFITDPPTTDGLADPRCPVFQTIGTIANALRARHGAKDAKG